MKADKQKYNDIQIPQGLSFVLEQAEIRKKRRDTGRLAAGSVLALALILASSNTPAVYASLSEVPVIGTVARVFHLGGGGVRSDGIKMGAETDGERLRLVFGKMDAGNSQASEAPTYTVEKLPAPDRLSVTINGIREFDPETFIQKADQSAFIRRAYREIVMDDSSVRMILELEPDTGYEVTEYQNPASLELHLFFQKQEEREIWFVRSEKMDMSEQLALLAEQLSDKKGVAAGTKDGRYIISVGKFRTEAEADRALQEIRKIKNLGSEFETDHCMSSERPD